MLTTEYTLWQLEAGRERARFESERGRLGERLEPLDLQRLEEHSSPVGRPSRGRSDLRLLAVVRVAAAEAGLDDRAAGTRAHLPVPLVDGEVLRVVPRLARELHPAVIAQRRATVLDRFVDGLDHGAVSAGLGLNGAHAGDLTADLDALFTKNTTV